MTKPSAQKRKANARATMRAGEKVFEVAADLFYSQSIRAVGVETIVKQAGVAKIGLYRSFASKDDLIVAYLDSRNAEYWCNVDRVVAKHKHDPRAQLRALIDHVAVRATTPGYRGCPFINYAAEFPNADHPGHRLVDANKREMLRRLVGLADAMGTRRSAQLADALFLLIEGAYASSQTLGGRNGPAKTLPQAAEALVEFHVKA
jgi:AcrR family transcriptional regulator